MTNNQINEGAIYEAEQAKLETQIGHLVKVCNKIQVPIANLAIYFKIVEAELFLCKNMQEISLDNIARYMKKEHYKNIDLSLESIKKAILSTDKYEIGKKLHITATLPQEITNEKKAESMRVIEDIISDFYGDVISFEEAADQIRAEFMQYK
jgi:hypothetical protein